MKGKAYENSKLKYQLLEKKRRGVKEVIWSLKPEQKEFIEESLGFTTEEYLFWVETRTFYNVRELDSLLKDIHYLKKRGKRKKACRLNNRQKKLLDAFGVNYWPYKYKIILCS